MSAFVNCCCQKVFVMLSLIMSLIDKISDQTDKHYKKNLNYRRNFINGTLSVGKISLLTILSTYVIRH